MNCFEEPSSHCCCCMLSFPSKQLVTEWLIAWSLCHLLHVTSSTSSTSYLKIKCLIELKVTGVLCNAVLNWSIKTAKNIFVWFLEVTFGWTDIVVTANVLILIFHMNVVTALILWFSCSSEHWWCASDKFISFPLLPLFQLLALKKLEWK